MEMRSEVEIARPADEVFSMIADMARNPEWQRGMVSCDWTSEEPHGVGSTYEQVASFMGKRILTTFEVTEFEPPERIRIQSIVSTFPLDVTRTVEPTATGCIVTAIVRGEPGGMMRLFAPVLRRQAQRSIDADYQRLIALLER